MVKKGKLIYSHNTMTSHFKETIEHIFHQQVQEIVARLGEKYGFDSKEALFFLQEQETTPNPEPVPDTLTIKKPKKKRKNVETPWTEYIAAVVFQHPEATFDQLTSLPLELTETMKQAYLLDMEKRPEKCVREWFDTCKERTAQWRTSYGITDTDKMEVFLTGKKVRNPRVAELLKPIKDKKQQKADIFICVNGERWIGISIKTTHGDPLSNWSIEKLIRETTPDVANELKEHKTKLLTENGIERNWREKKEENRAKYNAVMHGKNVYKETLHDWISDNAGTTLKDIIAAIAGSSITEFSNHKYDGTAFEDLCQTYTSIKESDMKMVADCPETKQLLETQGLKQHYSDTAAKLWYYVKVGDSFKYRFEIRWKGDPFASPQLMLYTL